MSDYGIPDNGSFVTEQVSIGSAEEARAIESIFFEILSFSGDKQLLH